MESIRPIRAADAAFLSERPRSGPSFSVSGQLETQIASMRVLVASQLVGKSGWNPGGDADVWKGTVYIRGFSRLGEKEDLISTDKAGWLGGTTKREGFSQFFNACEHLGNRVIFANPPHAKGRNKKASCAVPDSDCPRQTWVTHSLKN